jgi:hypothetical protein
MSAATPEHHRWKRSPRRITTLACDAVVWTVWFLMVAVVILAMCALLWLAAP